MRKNNILIFIVLILVLLANMLSASAAETKGVTSGKISSIEKVQTQNSQQEKKVVTKAKTIRVGKSVEFRQEIKIACRAYAKPRLIGKFKITFYCSCHTCTGKYPESKNYGKTATETKALEGHTIAVDPKLIPYGSKVFIEGFGTFFAEDKGGAIKDKKIDIYMDNHYECLDLGVKSAKVYFIK